MKISKASRQNSVLSSVFPTTASSLNIPTTPATPNSSFLIPGQPLVEPSEYNYNSGAALDTNLANEQIKWNRAWQTATSFLTLPRRQLKPDITKGETTIFLRPLWMKDSTVESQDAISYLLSSKFTNGESQSLLEWYLTEVRKHIMDWIRPDIITELENENIQQALHYISMILLVAQDIYKYAFKEHLIARWPDRNQARQKLRQFLRNVHSAFTYAVPNEKFSKVLYVYLWNCSVAILNPDMKLNEGSEEPCLLTKAEAERQKLLVQMVRLQKVGLGSDRAERIFGEVMNKLMGEHIHKSYTGDWYSTGSVSNHLRDWIENKFSRLGLEVLHQLNGSKSDISFRDVGKMQEMAIAKLGRLRVGELFDIVVEWNATVSAVEDLKLYINSLSRRTELTRTFTDLLNQRLLHPGASTIQILQAYISIIRAFTHLDPKGVLLDRVARPIRRYLRERDDTVNVIVTGLLANTLDEEGEPFEPNGEVLVELAHELNYASQLAIDAENDEGMDYMDLSWMPEPADAEPHYNSLKGSKIIGSIVSLFEPRETFIREFQKLLANRLLKKNSSLDDFEREIRVLEFLKAQFGEGSLQACEVMLRDLLDSKRVDLTLRNDELPIPSGHVMEVSPSSLAIMPRLQAKILSRLYWPSLHDEPFQVPFQIAQLQMEYEKGYENLKQSRKLNWLNLLGQVTVEIDLEDRLVTEECSTWQATVISAFQHQNGLDLEPATEGSKSKASAIQKSANQLSLQLSMPIALVRNALTFWVNKQVIRHIHDDIYEALESILRQNDDSGLVLGLATTVPTEAYAEAPINHSEAISSAQEMTVCWQFIHGMLTNGGPMPFPKIEVMLRFAVPGEFAFDGGALRAFLAEKVNNGLLEMDRSGIYRISR
ncbi:MAG: hypothetical protein M1829_004629 [Trizodia sp. TS-e1964]|nr:MAG: hypothetical protein M1829_004629 [Trizodia sp. TS-e1964]